MSIFQNVCRMLTYVYPVLYTGKSSYVNISNVRCFYGHVTVDYCRCFNETVVIIRLIVYPLCRNGLDIKVNISINLCLLDYVDDKIA